MSRAYAQKGSFNLGALNALAVLSGGQYDSSDEYYVVVSGTFVGTITFQGSIDGTNWFALKALDAAAGTAVSTTTAVGAWNIQNPPAYVRLNMTAYTSGTAVASACEVTVE